MKELYEPGRDAQREEIESDLTNKGQPSGAQGQKDRSGTGERGGLDRTGRYGTKKYRP